MTTVITDEEKKKKRNRILIVIGIIVLIIAAILIFWFRSKITATTMRILRIEGTVTLEDDGKDKTITTNLRLNSGNALSTAIKSLVSIGLDEVKIVTLDEKSRAVFNQSGRKLELDLTDGSLFFEVQKPLEDDESFDISTSTMVVGIRGTSGWVSVDGEHESLIVTDGVVHVIGTNPVTGEVKEIDVKAGQRINVYLYNDRTVDSIMFEVVEITERDLPEFVLERLRENRELLEKVCRETGWDKPWILGLTEEDIPKVVMDSSDSDDDGSSEVSEPDIELPDTGEEEPEVAENNEHEGPLTEEELAWAHSHIAIIDPNTGVFALKDMTLFDPAFYAATNPDVVAKYGTDPDALLWHYLKRGKREGRPPIAPRTPTPTITPTWGIVNEHDGDSYDDNSGEKKETNSLPSSTTSLTYNKISLGQNTPSGSLQFSGTNDAKGATANITFDPNASPRGTINVTSPDTSGPNAGTRVTIPSSIHVDYDGTNYSFSPNLSPNQSNRNVSLNFNDPSMNNVTSVDLSSAMPTGGSWVNSEGMLDFMNNNGQLTEILGPASNLTRTGSNPTTYTATGKTGEASIYNLSINDLTDYISNMGTNNVTETTYPGANNGPGLDVKYQNNRTETTIGTNTYTDIQVTANQNKSTTGPLVGLDDYLVTGMKGNQRVTFGYATGNDGFTQASPLP